MSFSPRTIRFAALRIVGIYALLAALWIYLSDQALGLLVQDHALMVRIAVYKGFLFIVVTATVLYQLISRYLQTVLETSRAAAVHQERLKSLVEGSVDAIYAKDTAGRYLLFNDAACRMTGKQAAEVLGNDDSALFPTAEAAIVMAGDRQVMAGGKLTTYEEVVTLADGQRHTFLSTKWPILDENGTVTGLFGTARDVTELKRTQNILESERARLRNLVQTMPALVWMKDVNGVYVGCNSRFERFFGAPETEIVGKTDYDFVDAELADFFRANDQKALAADGPSINEEWITYADDGHRELLETIKAPVRDSEGNLLGVMGIARDITAHRQAEEELRTERQRFKGLVDSIDGIVWEADAETLAFTYVSLQAERLLGYPVAAWYEPGFREARLHPDDLPWVPARFRELTRSDGDHTLEYRLMARDGETVWLHDIVTVVTENDVPRWFRGIMVNITGKKAEEEEKRRLEAQLLQAQKMEAIGRLAGGVAHDFNNMLTVIIGYAEIARKQGAAHGNYHEHLSQIIKAATQSRDITQQLLAFSRKELISPRVLDLNAQVNAVKKGMGRFIGEDIRFELRLAPDLWPVHMDPAQVDQVIMNLVVNARDAMADGGTLTIETQNLHLDDTHTAMQPDSLPGDYVQLAVSDTGCGMDSETVQHIFEPFFTTKGAGKGTGLGLATLYGIVTQNKGFVRVYSEPGMGTTFKVFIPRCGVQPEGAAADEEVCPECREISVLLVEDDEAVRMIITEMLEQLGCAVVVAATPREALADCQGPGRHFDLLLTDVVMPGMNGRELAHEIRAREPAIRVLFMSGYTAEVITQRGVLDGGLHFIPKPFDQRALQRKISEVMSSDPAP
jgi:PAS domain S-box-containing protein